MSPQKDLNFFLFRKWLWQKEKSLNDVIITVLIVQDQLSLLIDEMPVILAPLFGFLKTKLFNDNTHTRSTGPKSYTTNCVTNNTPNAKMNVDERVDLPVEWQSVGTFQLVVKIQKRHENCCCCLLTKHWN
jgi:hypothetical protein